MSVASANQIDVDVARALVRERLEELLDQRERKVFVDEQHLAVHRYVEDEIRAAGEVDHDARERLVERDVGVAEAPDAALVAEGGGEDFTEDQTDVFDGVVIVDERVAGGADVEIELAVARDRVEHVRQETDRRVDLRAAGAVDVDRDLDRSLFCGACERGGSHASSFSAARKASFSSRVPIDTRRNVAYLRMRGTRSRKSHTAALLRKAMKFEREGYAVMFLIARIALKTRSRSAMSDATFASR